MWLVFCYFVIKYVKKENIKKIWNLINCICLKNLFWMFFFGFDIDSLNKFGSWYYNIVF